MIKKVKFSKFEILDSRNLKISEFLLELTKAQTDRHLHFLAASSLVAASRDSKLIPIFNSGYSFCDSAPLARALRTRHKDFSNIRGSDFLRSILNMNNAHFRHFFIGPNELTLNVLSNYAKNLDESTQIVGQLVPEYATDFSNYYSVWTKTILDANADIVWIGLGSPKQDVLAKDLSEMTGRVCIAVGAAMEFVGGTRPEAPKIVQTLYLEWFFRLISNPRRLLKRYTVDNLIFIYLVLRYLFSASR